MLEGVGQQLRPLYLRYVELKNKQARLNGFADYGDQWRQKYETTEMEKIVQNLYAQVEPLYKELHAFIRRRLYQVCIAILQIIITLLQLWIMSCDHH